MLGCWGFAYDAVCRIARATEARRANQAYWREMRNRSRHHALSRPHLGHPDVGASIAAQLDHPVFLASPRRCPECRETFVLIRVQGVELDTCLECGSFWLDKGEFGSLTAHEEIVAQSIPGGRSTHPCPVCGVSMTQRTISPAAPIRLDACPAGHGIYFERGELLKLLAAEHHLKAPD